MNIVLIGAAYPFRGGIASFTHRLGETLVEFGHQVRIITFTVQYPNVLFPGTTQFQEGPSPTNLQIERNISSINPLTWLNCGNKLRKSKPDLIIFQHWMPFFAPSYGTIAHMAAKNRHTKIACLAHNIVPHEKRFFDKTFNKFLTRSIRNYVVLSESVKQDLLQIDSTLDVRVSPHPVYDHYGAAVRKEEACEKLNLPLEFTYLLFFGFIRKYKGLDLLIDAMNDPYFKENNIRLIIAGEYYDDQEVYQSKIKNLLNPDVIISHTRFIPDARVPYYFSAASLVVQPYRSATQSGISQLAIFYEKPMVVTDVGGLKEIIGNIESCQVVEVNGDAINLGIKKALTFGDSGNSSRDLALLKNRLGWDNFTNNFLEF